MKGAKTVKDIFQRHQGRSMEVSAVGYHQSTAFLRNDKDEEDQTDMAAYVVIEALKTETGNLILAF